MIEGIEGIKEQKEKEGMSESELRMGWELWMASIHPNKPNPKIISIRGDKIYFNWDGGQETMVHKRVIEDRFFVPPTQPQP